MPHAHLATSSLRPALTQDCCVDRFPSSRTLRIRFVSDVTPRTFRLRFVSDVTPRTFRLRFVSDVTPRTFRLRFVSDVTYRTLRIGRYVSVSFWQTCRPSITMRSRSRRPPAALMLMGCNEAMTASPPSQQPSRARHSAQHHQELPGALRGTQWRAHRRSLRKRDGAAANARCR